jgi:hypothetical protein
MRVFRHLLKWLLNNKSRVYDNNGTSAHQVSPFKKRSVMKVASQNISTPKMRVGVAVKRAARKALRAA